MKEQHCLQCGEPFSGRADKKFCTESCRSSYHYYHSQEKEDSLYKIIDKQLKTNRRILKGFNRAGEAKARKQLLVVEGLNPKDIMYHRKAKNGNENLICYEYRIIKKIENNKPACR